MHKLTLGMWGICMGCGPEGLTHEEAQAAYAALDNGAVGISVMLLEALDGKLQGTSLTLEPAPSGPCDPSVDECMHLSIDLQGQADYGWEGSVHLEGFGGVYTEDRTVWQLTAANLSLTFQGTTLRAATAAMTIVEGAYMSQGAPETLTYATVVGCGADIAGHADIDFDYVAIYDAAELFMDSNVSFAWEAQQTLLQDQPNGYLAADHGAQWIYILPSCP